MYSDHAQTFFCVERHLNILEADPTVLDLLARKPKFSTMVGRILGEDRPERHDTLRRSNGRACLTYVELEASLIEIESVIHARPPIASATDKMNHSISLPTSFSTIDDQLLLTRSQQSIWWLPPQLAQNSSKLNRGEESTLATSVPDSSLII